MEVTYKNSLPDILRFNLYCLPRMRAIQLMYLIVIPVLGYSIWSSISASNGETTVKVILFFIILALTLSFIVAGSLVFIIMGLFLGKDKTFNATKTVSVSVENVIQTTEFGRNETAWSGIYKVATNERLIFIFLTSKSAHIIPKRAFNTVEQAEEFYKFSLHHWKVRVQPAPTDRRTPVST